MMMMVLRANPALLIPQPDVGSWLTKLFMTSAIKLSPRATQENHRTCLLKMVSTIGLMMSIPPRIRSIAKTMLTPSMVYATVVVTTTNPVPIPDSSVHLVGLGSEYVFWPIVRLNWVANFHHLIVEMKIIMLMTDAPTETGRISPLVILCSSMKPFVVSAFVRKEYGT